jgi:hypothetical protein
LQKSEIFGKHEILEKNFLIAQYLSLPAVNYLRLSLLSLINQVSTTSSNTAILDFCPRGGQSATPSLLLFCIIYNEKHKLFHSTNLSDK